MKYKLIAAKQIVWRIINPPKGKVSEHAMYTSERNRNRYYWLL